jgi:DNA-binding transcriptional regulator GbsR (MarR family)
MTAAPTADPGVKSERDPDEVVAEFVEQLGLIVEAEGLPRIAGRILAFLVVHGGPFSFSELAERLKISRGSVSTNTRLLENMGMIVRTTRAGERQDFFRLATEPYQQFLARFVERSRRAQSAVDSACAALPADWKAARERMGDLSDFYRRFCEMSQAIAIDLRRRA